MRRRRTTRTGKLQHLGGKGGSRGWGTTSASVYSQPLAPFQVGTACFAPHYEQSPDKDRGPCSVWGEGPKLITNHRLVPMHVDGCPAAGYEDAEAVLQLMDGGLLGVHEPGSASHLPFALPFQAASPVTCTTTALVPGTRQAGTPSYSLSMAALRELGQEAAKKMALGYTAGERGPANLHHTLQSSI